MRNEETTYKSTIAKLRAEIENGVNDYEAMALAATHLEENIRNLKAQLKDANSEVGHRESKIENMLR
jgi:predicted  nucleic acid-binding Zn-ribbon protein